MSEASDTSTTIKPTAPSGNQLTLKETLDGFWLAHGLQKVGANLALDATITAQTLSSERADLARDASVSAAQSAENLPAKVTDSLPQLPMISLDVARETLGQQLGKLSGAATQGGKPDLEAKSILGEGGMGRVLLATQHSLQREVAVKVLKPEAITHSVVRALLIEALTAGSLEHPNVIPIHALGTDTAGHPLLVMKRVDGVSWRTVLEDPTHSAWERLTETSHDRLVASVQVLMEVCNAVQFAHERNIVHRDIKPENVMLGSHGEVYLVDWGIAVRKADEPARALVGTPCYMAPEMLSGDSTAVDARTDVYLLGATLHEVLTQKPRHSGDTLYATIFAALESAPHAYGPEISTELAALANRACHADPALRPQSAKEFRAALAEWIRHRSSATLAGATATLAEQLAQLAIKAQQGDPTARASFDRVATECRFGFAQSLKEWPENPVALSGLQHCLTQMIDLEIARENPENARSLLSEMHGDQSSLVARVQQLESQLAKRNAAHSEAAKLAHELDDQVAIRERTLLMMALLGLGATITGYMGVRGGFANVSVVKSIKFGSFAFAVMIVAVIALRKKLLSNAFNKRVVAVVLISFGAMNLHRILAHVRGAQMVSEVLADDTIIIAAVVALASITIQSWFAVVAALLASTGVLISFFPDKASLLFSVGPFIAIGTAIILHRRTFTANANKGSGA
jgi:serine/threonine-protein kinase